jgi:hypothetical protein
MHTDERPELLEEIFAVTHDAHGDIRSARPAVGIRIRSGHCEGRCASHDERPLQRATFAAWRSSENECRVDAMLSVRVSTTNRAFQCTPSTVYSRRRTNRAEAARASAKCMHAELGRTVCKTTHHLVPSTPTEHGPRPEGSHTRAKMLAKPCMSRIVELP